MSVERPPPPPTKKEKKKGQPDTFPLLLRLFLYSLSCFHVHIAIMPVHAKYWCMISYSTKDFFFYNGYLSVEFINKRLIANDALNCELWPSRLFHSLAFKLIHTFAMHCLKSLASQWCHCANYCDFFVPLRLVQDWYLLLTILGMLHEGQNKYRNPRNDNGHLASFHSNPITSNMTSYHCTNYMYCDFVFNTRMAFVFKQYMVCSKDRTNITMTMVIYFNFTPKPIHIKYDKLPLYELLWFCI